MGNAINISLEKMIHDIGENGYYIDRLSVVTPLEDMSYDISEGPDHLRACRNINEYDRYHLKIDTRPDGAVDGMCMFSIHKDLNYREIGHSLLVDQDVTSEFRTFRKNFLNYLKTNVS